MNKPRPWSFKPSFYFLFDIHASLQFLGPEFII
jgi:hypothetical protein